MMYDGSYRIYCFTEQQTFGYINFQPSQKNNFLFYFITMTDLQLEIMRLWADKTLGFGCMVEISDTYYDAVKNKETNIGRRLKIISNEMIEWDYIVVWWIIKNKILNIIWHPITRWRLCYLQSIKNSKDTSTRYRLKDYFELTNWLYDKTILDRPEDFCENILLPFLESIECNLQEHH